MMQWKRKKIFTLSELSQGGKFYNRRGKILKKAIFFIEKALSTNVNLAYTKNL